MLVINKKFKVFVLFLAFTFAVFLASPVIPAYAADADSLRQLFDRLDRRVSNGDWYIGYNNEGGTLAWGEARVMRAYLGMYQVSGDTYYLDKFVRHADSVLKMRDSARGVTDYRGRCLPAWRAGSRYTEGRGFYIYAVHTGMIANPLAGFAKIVYADPSLSKYKTSAGRYLQAAKDAIAVHDADFVDNGTTGYYRDPKGCPEKFDGLGIPFNQYLAMARAQLTLYDVTGDKLYLNRVTKMARHFKSYLETDRVTDSYQWRYWWGPGFDGWTAADNLSTHLPSYPGLKGYEDTTHSEIGVDFAYLAFKAGIVFNENDMQKFGRTVEKKMLHSDGNVALLVNGAGTINDNIYIGGWLKYHKYAPSLLNYCIKVSERLTSVNGFGLEAVAKINEAYKEQTNPGPVPNPPVESEIITNGDFNNGMAGWIPSRYTFKTESNGNKYVALPRSSLYQELKLPAGSQYKLNGQTRKGTSSGTARFVVGYYDASGKLFSTGVSVFYKHNGAGWESIPEQTFTVPSGTVTTRITLFTSKEDGTHDYDNISIKPVSAASKDTIPPTVQVAKPAAGAFLSGPITLAAVADDNIGVTAVRFQYQSGSQTWSELGDAMPGSGTWIFDWHSAGVTDGTYNIRAIARDAAGNSAASGSVTVTIDNTGPVVDELSFLPSTISPNELTSLSYRLSEDANVLISLYDQTGNLVRVLDSGSKTKGVNQLQWDGTNGGIPVNDGTYTCEITATDRAGNQSGPASKDITVLTKVKELIINGDFSQGVNGWIPSRYQLKTETNSNKYVSLPRSSLYQELKLPVGGRYKLSGQTRKGTASGTARFVVGYYDASGKLLSTGASVFYKHKAAGWESIPEQTFTVPAGTATTRITLFTSTEDGTHDFDNISIEQVVR